MFTIRVYGLLLHGGAVLVADELIKGRRITKFPGGGLEYGEGLKDRVVDPGAIPVVDVPFTGIHGPQDQEVFRWLPLATSGEEELSLPIDRHVWRMLRDR